MLQIDYANPDSSILDSSCTRPKITLLQCIDPYLVNPVVYHRSRLISAESTNFSDHSETDLEMEEFSDLTLLLSGSAQRPKFAVAQVPEYENFGENEKTNLTDPQIQSPGLEETEVLQFSNRSIDSDIIYTNYGSIVDTDKPDSVNDTMTQFFDLPSEALNCDYDSLRDSSDYFHLENVKFEATNSSTCRVSTESHLKPNLQLNFDKKFVPDIINTPDVIEAVTSLENSFRIPTKSKEVPQVEQLDQDLYLDSSSLLPLTFDDNSFEEVFDVKIVKAEEVLKECVLNANENNATQRKFSCQSTSLSDFDDVSNTSSRKRTIRKPLQHGFVYSSASDDDTVEDVFDVNIAVNNEQTPDCTDDDDDDEDYIPRKKFSRQKNLSSDLKDVDDVPKRRGRPPKKNVRRDSVSSNVDKYRELRDKNNEASRKSRQKRRAKEQQLMDEADELSNKNTKLKAQVAELERAVSNYRQNLFKIMMKK